MPRIRTLKPDHRSHRKIARISDAAYRLWVSCILEADDEGRFRVDFEILGSATWPVQKRRPKDLKTLWDELVRVGLIHEYGVEGNLLAWFPSWSDHQRIDRPTPSRLPQPSPRSNLPDAVRRDAVERAGAKAGSGWMAVHCHYCGAEGRGILHEANGGASLEGLEFDHVVPIQYGGSNEASNIVVSCDICNRNKDLSTFRRSISEASTSPRRVLDLEGKGRERKGKEGNNISPRSGEMADSSSTNGWGSPEDLITLYNAQAPDECPAVETPSAARRKKAQQYLAQFPAKAFWEDAFQEIHLSSFLRGLRPHPGHEHFRATFDWLLSKGKNDGIENIVKVQEGRYRDEKKV